MPSLWTFSMIVKASGSEWLKTYCSVKTTQLHCREIVVVKNYLEKFWLFEFGFLFNEDFAAAADFGKLWHMSIL